MLPALVNAKTGAMAEISRTQLYLTGWATCDKISLRDTMSKRNEEIIQAAIESFEAQKRRLNEQIAELRGMLSGANAESVSASPSNGRRTMSPAARRRIAEAQRKRWAAKRAATGQAAPQPAKKAKRHLSPEGRRRIIEATKKRWAAVRAAAAKRGK